MIRTAALLLLAAAAVLGRAVFDDAPPTRDANLAGGTPTECVRPEQIVPDHVLYVNGLVRIPLCTPGTLRITLTGSAVRGRGAHALVTVGSEARWEGEVLSARSLDVTLDAPAWVTISLLNDRREGPDDRNLWISELAFDAF